MGETDHATLEARLARVSWERLREVSIALDGCAGPDEAAERVAARGLVPLDWFAGDVRRYSRAGKPRRGATPGTVSGVALAAAAHRTMAQCEALAREAYARAAPWGWRTADEQALWSVVPGRFAAPEGTSMVRGAFVSATHALDELSARSFEYEPFLWSDAPAGRSDEAPTPCSLAAASVLTTRTAWRALGREGPSPAEPIVELYALGVGFCLDVGGLELLLPEPEFPLLACAKCARIEPYAPVRVAGETRRECPSCGLFCRACLDDPPDAPCPLCGGPAVHRRVGPARY